MKRGTGGRHELKVHPGNQAKLSAPTRSGTGLGRQHGSPGQASEVQVAPDVGANTQDDPQVHLWCQGYESPGEGGNSSSRTKSGAWNLRLCLPEASSPAVRTAGTYSQPAHRSPWRRQDPGTRPPSTQRPQSRHPEDRTGTTRRNPGQTPAAPWTSAEPPVPTRAPPRMRPHEPRWLLLPHLPLSVCP